jgi:tetratricopeptide (TPR) repeat protein
MSNLNDFPQACFTCGQKDEMHEPPGSFLLLSLSDTLLLNVFLNHLLDLGICEVCESPLGLQPTFLYRHEKNRKIYFVLGVWKNQYRNQIINTIEKLASYCTPALDIEELNTLKELRDFIVQQDIFPRIEKALPLFSIKQDNLNGFLADNWQYFTAQVMRLCKDLVLNIPQMGFLDDNGNKVPEEFLINRLEEAQIKTLYYLFEGWTKGVFVSSQIEEDLSIFLQENALMLGLTGTFSEFVKVCAAAVEYKPETFLFHYCLRALQASFCLAAKLENSDERIWSQCFFALEVYYHIGNEAQKSELSSYIISFERAERTTKYESIGDAFLSWYRQSDITPKTFAIFTEIVKKAGKESIISEIPNKVRVEGLNAAKIIEIVKNSFSKTSRRFKTKREKRSYLISTARYLSNDLLEKGQLDEIKKVSDWLIELWKNDYESLAEIETWLGFCYKILRKPQDFLDRIGVVPRDWENSLSPYTKVMLWTERSNILRLVGRFKEALSLIENVIAEFPEEGSEKDRRVAYRNRAILLRENGALDAAIKSFEKLLDEADNDVERVDTLDSLAMSSFFMGQEDKVASYYRTAVKLSVNYPERKAEMQAKLALALVFLHTQEAIEIIKNLDSELDSSALLAVGSVWENLLINGYKLSAEENELAIDSLSQLINLYKTSETAKDVQVQLLSMELIAGFSEVLEGFDAEVAYNDLYEQYHQNQLFPTSQVVCALAFLSYQKGDFDRGRSFLLQLPESILNETARTSDFVGASIGKALSLRKRLNDISQVVLTAASVIDICLLAEIKREVIGRERRSIITKKNYSNWSIEKIFDDDELFRIAGSKETIVVLEWLSSRDKIAGIITLISKKNGVVKESFEFPN